MLSCSHCSVQIGFLYLRYVCPPRDLWEWLGPFCGDREVRQQLCWWQLQCCLQCSKYISSKVEAAAWLQRRRVLQADVCLNVLRA